MLMLVLSSKEIYNLSDCELENEVRDFDDLPMDLDERNDIYDEGLPLEDNIHQINDDFGFQILGNILIYVVLSVNYVIIWNIVIMYVCSYVVLKLGT